MTAPSSLCARCNARHELKSKRSSVAFMLVPRIVLEGGWELAKVCPAFVPAVRTEGE